MKKLFVLLVLLGITSVGSASEHFFGDILLRYDLDSTTAIGCVLVGDPGAPLTQPRQVPVRIETAGLVTATTAVTAGTSPFAGMAVGDIIIANEMTRAILVYTDADTIVVDEAWDLSAGYVFSWYDLNCSATGGWFPVAGFDTWTATWRIDQVNVTGGIDVRLECRGGGRDAAPTQVWPDCLVGACGTYQNYAGIAGITSTTSVTTDSFAASECRFLFLINTADDLAGDAGADMERITITFEAER
jgi:hypothetical protein